MNIAFRVDASEIIGTGHFMRCLTLADKLKSQRSSVRFLSRHLPLYLQKRLEEKGFEFSLLQSPSHKEISHELSHSHWLATSQEADARDSISALSDQQWDWLVVDHYALDACWESALGHITKKIMVIDDLADRKHDCDLLLDQNLYADMDIRYPEKVVSSCHLLLGPHYALLRDDFQTLHKQAKKPTIPVKQILVFLGGVDSDNVTTLCIEALAGFTSYNWGVDVVIGIQHPCIDQIKSLCTQYGFSCHVQTDKMAILMAAADLAIGAGGSASWERCCLGLPAVIVSLADNQIEVARELDHYGACIYLGAAEGITIDSLRKALLNLFSSHDQLTALSKISYSLVDGLGTHRICQKLLLH